MIFVIFDHAFVVLFFSDHFVIFAVSNMYFVSYLFRYVVVSFCAFFLYYFVICMCFDFVFLLFRVPLFLLWLLFSSDDFIQAQQQLARWASEDVVSVVVMEQPLTGTTSDSQQSSGGGGHTSGAASTNTVIHHQHPHQHHGDHPSSAQATSTTTVSSSVAGGTINPAHTMSMGGVVPNGIGVNQRDYYPSPPSTETESSGSVIQPLNRRYTIQGDTSQQQLQLHQLHQHQHQSHHQQQQAQQQHQQQQLQMQGDTTTSSSNNSQSGQIMENGRYPEYKHW